MKINFKIEKKHINDEYNLYIQLLNNNLISFNIFSKQSITKWFNNIKKQLNKNKEYNKLSLDKMFSQAWEDGYFEHYFNNYLEIDLMDDLIFYWHDVKGIKANQFIDLIYSLIKELSLNKDKWIIKCAHCHGILNDLDVKKYHINNKKYYLCSECENKLDKKINKEIQNVIHHFLNI